MMWSTDEDNIDTNKVINPALEKISADELISSMPEVNSLLQNIVLYNNC